MLFNAHGNAFYVLSSDVFLWNFNLVVHNPPSSLETSVYSATINLYQVVFKFLCFSREVQKPSIKFNSLIKKLVLYNTTKFTETSPPK